MARRSLGPPTLRVCTNEEDAHPEGSVGVGDARGLEKRDLQVPTVGMQCPVSQGQGPGEAATAVRREANASHVPGVSVGTGGDRAQLLCAFGFGHMAHKEQTSLPPRPSGKSIL